ncbi:MAG: RIP metalloprotease RseP [Clostridia bacterium]
MLSFFINAVKIIFVLGFLVFIHESGHFLVAKFFKVKVNEFSIGFGKKIFSKTKGGTTYSVRIVPLGGFVSMLGEDERSDDERSFSKQSVPKRIAICAAGGLVNIIFGLLVYFCLLLCFGNFVSNKVDSLISGYGAETSGILPGDEIVSINGKKIFISSDISKVVSNNGNNELNIVVKRNGEKKNIKVIPTEVKNKSIGIYFDDSDECKISYIYKDSPADEKLKIGDVILAANGEEINGDYEKLTQIIQESDGEILLKIKSGGKEEDVSILPKEYSTYYIGVVFKQASKDFQTRLYYSWFETGNFMLSLADNVKSLFTAKVSVNDMMGPIGISKTVAETSGIYDFIYLMALISLSLGITNLLPIPALDGGKILILLIEAIRRKPMNESTEIFIQMIGFSLLILLSIYISYIDILRFF